MGVVVGAQVWDLILPESEVYADVKVTVKGLTVGEALDFGEFLDGVHIAPIMANKAEVDARNHAYSLFASRVVEWNLESAPGVPLSKDLEGMLALDWRWGRDFIRAWVKGVASTVDPLPERSSVGAPSEVASIPMEPLSENPGN